MKACITITINETNKTAEFKFGYVKGAPAHYVKSTGSWEPPEHAEIDIEWVKIDCGGFWQDCPQWLVDILANDDLVINTLLEAASDQEQERDDNSQFGVGA